jgi:hypothetical protein
MVEALAAVTTMLTKLNMRVMRLLLLTGIIASSSDALASPRPVFRALFVQCLAAKACVNGLSSSCTAQAMQCESFVAGVGVPLQLACMMARRGNKEMRVLASDPATNGERVSAIVSYGSEHPEELGQGLDETAVLAITAELPCTGAPESVFFEPK